jgi:hypothetical protein
MADGIRRHANARIALVLWIVWAIVVWNVVFDRVIVVAGREYVRGALAAARGGGPYARMDDWMRPAVGRGLWIATAAAAAIVVVGMGMLRIAAARDNPPKSGSPVRSADGRSGDER